MGIPRSIQEFSVTSALDILGAAHDGTGITPVNDHSPREEVSMVRIRFISAGKVQVGTSPEDTVTFGGEPGETAEVPSDIAALLVGLGHAEVVECRSKKKTPRS